MGSQENLSEWTPKLLSNTPAEEDKGTCPGPHLGTHQEGGGTWPKMENPKELCGLLLTGQADELEPLQVPVTSYNWVWDQCRLCTRLSGRTTWSLCSTVTPSGNKNPSMVQTPNSVFGMLVPPPWDQGNALVLGQ